MILVRIRGKVKVRKKIEDTLNMLKLNRNNHAVLIRANESYLGMLQKVKDYITWGEIDKDTLTQLLRKKGMLEGRKKLTDEYLKKNTDFQSIEELSSAIFENKANIEDIYKVKPVFRLHPPKKGFRAKIKKGYSQGGALGNRKEEINDLIKRML
ncbi:MAG: 50S ribosomal protein L30 [Candidatus Lokiarchaeota archaeon]|nr:50S ribosomal protein L30 [Candidatus Lokiarchaeota archaeon]